MNRIPLNVQALLLASGTALSWLTLVGDYRRFFSAGGHVFELSGCIVRNPLLTPCLYGALAFLTAFAWSIVVLRSAPEAIAKRQRGLHWLLAAGTVFAWGNFGVELYLYSVQRPSSGFSCPPSGEVLVNPLMTPCFYGALIFLAALVTSWLILKARR